MAESFLFAGHQVAKCLTGNQNVPQSTEGLPDILSDTPEIILAITAGTKSRRLKHRPHA